MLGTENIMVSKIDTIYSLLLDSLVVRKINKKQTNKNYKP